MSDVPWLYNANTVASICPPNENDAEATGVPDVPAAGVFSVITHVSAHITDSLSFVNTPHGVAGATLPPPRILPAVIADTGGLRRDIL